MCPLRLILIFLSATLAGFFVVRNLKCGPPPTGDGDCATNESNNGLQSTPSNSKVRSAMISGFWTTVDMASGRYLWRHLASSSKRLN
ncbi:uncharacterized protein LOC126669945 [Mercurialis annua]|uniref:uncharacterized protein LOC126669945 n=1 Tax=Mercurialis annua TaxID=3986 RepID=UPI002160596F|nr:uncharacterized protein LOC126669945 [Mercurialis annua]